MRNKNGMPRARQDRPSEHIQWDLSPRALERWTPGLTAAAVPAAGAADNTISVLDVIGVDPWTGDGVTAKRISAALRSIGADTDVTVNVNSPGGDMFEGLAIYNLLREHQGAVTVKVLGLAASAASIIAMAADELLVARAGFLMIHNCWGIVIGNRLDMIEMADTLEPFDAAMADIYAARSGIDAAAVQKMMDAEKWIGGSAAVDQGFADGLLAADAVKTDTNASSGRVAAYLLDMALAKAGMPRSERRSMLQEYKSGTPRAAGTGTPCAVEDGTPCAAVASDLMTAMRSFSLTR